MIVSRCSTCGRRVWRVSVDGAVAYVEEATDVLRFPGAHNGGLAAAVRVSGIYRKHACAARMVFSPESFQRRKKSGNGRIPASVRRARARRIKGGMR